MTLKVVEFPQSTVKQTPSEFLRWLADELEGDPGVPQALRAGIVVLSCGPDGVVLTANSNCDMDYPLTHCGLADVAKTRALANMGELE